MYVKAVIGQTMSNCESKETCDACIQEIDCAWCSTPVSNYKLH